MGAVDVVDSAAVGAAALVVAERKGGTTNAPSRRAAVPVLLCAGDRAPWLAVRVVTVWPSEYDCRSENVTDLGAALPVESW